MILEIKKYPDPVLKKKAEKVEEITPEIKELIFNMKETLGPKRGVGLAAPQVGVSKKIIVVRTKNKLMAFINPEIIKRSFRKISDTEGCFSFPGLWLKIKRAKTIKVKALNEEGKEVFIDAQNFLAMVFQHEIDHLNNVLFFERLGFFQRIKVKQDLNKS
ncbi:peptide deformylase [Candidatus Parcubacteria bacterium]|nr:peptide deformylase [Candidatus Parcubacteria bacterium]